MRKGSYTGKDLRALRHATSRNWWAIGDSNPGPTGYEPVALTN